MCPYHYQSTWNLKQAILPIKKETFCKDKRTHNNFNAYTCNRKASKHTKKM